ncbi:hypothetical protein ACF07M_01500 [Streptomyces globisporus]|uniref:hypothetical protein n=1 Tax=Streptomyces TaxID=1883 RepID=UPI0036FCE5BE
MTATTAARAAVDPRPARGTAWRRAVQVVLFLGGLLALGLLTGGRAEAQERPDPGGFTAAVADAVPKGAVREGAVPEDRVRTAVGPGAPVPPQPFPIPGGPRPGAGKGHPL